MGPNQDQDNRLPIAKVGGLFSGMLELFGRIVRGEDPIRAVQHSLASGIVALGRDALRQEHAPPKTLLD